MAKNNVFSKQEKVTFTQIILEVVKTQKPETTKQLVQLVQEKTALSAEEVTQLLLQLEDEDLLYFTKKTVPHPLTFQAYLFSQKAFWYWVTITIAIATTIVVFTIPDYSYPAVYVRSAIGTVFVLFLPGYALLKTLFPSKIPFKTNSESMDTLERVALSFGMSLVLVPIVGLILNYTPWGIRLIPITLSLLSLTLIFATAGIMREYYAKALDGKQK